MGQTATKTLNGGEATIVSAVNANMKAKCAASLFPVWTTSFDARMNPTADAEKIQFHREADSRYRLVHEGSLEGSSKLSFVVRLVEEELGLKLQRGGYFGHGGFSSQTLQSDRPINTHVFGRKVRRLMRLPLKELAAIVRGRKLLGPKAAEYGFETFSEKTEEIALKTWCCDYYAANGNDCPESLAALERQSAFRWRCVPIDLLLHNLKGCFQTPLKVEVYRQLIENATALPPLICLRRDWDLLEGYHRLAAHQEAGCSAVACIVIGRS